MLYFDNGVATDGTIESTFYNSQSRQTGSEMLNIINFILHTLLLGALSLARPGGKKRLISSRHGFPSSRQDLIQQLPKKSWPRIFSNSLEVSICYGSTCTFQSCHVILCSLPICQILSLLVMLMLWMVSSAVEADHAKYYFWCSRAATVISLRGPRRTRANGRIVKAHRLQCPRSVVGKS